MEKLRHISRIAAASVFITGVAPACTESDEQAITVSSCSTEQTYRIDAPIYDQSNVLANLETEDDIIKDGNEIQDRQNTIIFNESMFPENVASLDDTDGRPARVLSNGMFQVAIEPPDSLHHVFDTQTEYINNLLPEGRKVSRIHIYEHLRVGESNNTISGRPIQSEEGENIIELEILPEAELSEDQIGRAVYHEGMHIVFDEIGPGLNFGWEGESADHWSMLRKTRTTALEKAFDQLQDQGHDTTDFSNKFFAGDIKLLGDLFNLVTESCYEGEGGHPTSNPDELFASTASVMKFFPDSYIASIQMLDKENKAIMDMLTHYVFSTLVKNAPEPHRAQEQFDEALVQYIDNLNHQ